MNKARREAIAMQIAEIEGVLTKLAYIRGKLEAIRDDEQEYYDNMPESFQAGQKGDNSQEAISLIENTISLIEDFENSGVEVDLQPIIE